MILNSRLFEFNKDTIQDLPEGVTHLRGFGWDFGRIDENGLPRRPFTSKLADWIDYVKRNELKVVWTMLVSKTFPVQEEIDYLQAIIDEGVEVTHIQLGGEYWQKRYFYGETQDPKVIEKITLDDYIEILDLVVPTLSEQLPECKLMALCCAHQYESEERNAIVDYFINSGEKLSAIKQKGHYLPIWNYKVCNYVSNSDFDLGVTIHYYSGAKDYLQPSNGEEAVFQGINFTPFIGQIRDESGEVEIIIAEAAWTPSDKSPEQLAKMIEFYEAGVAAIGDNGLMGLQVLHTRQEKDYNWFSDSGVTQVGQLFIDYFTEIDEPEPTEPVLVKILPDRKGEWVWWSKTYLTFSNGETYTRKLWMETRLFGSEDVGKPLSYFIDKIKK